MVDRENDESETPLPTVIGKHAAGSKRKSASRDSRTERVGSLNSEADMEKASQGRSAKRSKIRPPFRGKAVKAFAVLVVLHAFIFIIVGCGLSMVVPDQASVAQAFKFMVSGKEGVEEGAEGAKALEEEKSEKAHYLRRGQRQ
mmetsp:Transcript_6901/g.14544  ORF Transcript_6901/g.14544 Transcript_6901/m.14544 type:complete len:143 (-) Transcript_6901:176-604(-)